jgi:hypothetical protein
VKKLTVLMLALSVSFAVGIPAFADEAAAPKANTIDDTVKNIKVGSRNVAAGWVEVMDSTHEEASKGKGMGEQMTGLVAGGAIGARKTLHRAGAGAIDLLTFWIPKKQPLISPEKARLE